MQSSKEPSRPVYSANNPYAYAEQFMSDYHPTIGHFDSGLYIPNAEDHSQSAHPSDFSKPYHDGPTKAGRNKPSNPRGILPPIMRSEFLCISDLHWWTSHQDILQACHQAGVTLTREAVTSAEHKVNGKSKGCVYLTCKDADDAQKIGNWFRDNDFQGKKMPTAFASKDAIRALRTPAAISSNPRPTGGSLTSLANHPPTNAHGGINFNRLRQHGRAYGGNTGASTTAGLPRSHKATDSATMQPWQQPGTWTGLEPYQGALYLPAMHGMLPFVSPVDPGVYAMQAEYHYQ